MIGLVTCQAAGVAGKRTTLLELRATLRGRAHVCFVGLVVVLLVALAPGQTPTIGARQQAAVEPQDDEPVWECHVGVGTTRAIAVFNIGPLNDCRVGFVLHDLSTGQWIPGSQGLIDDEAGQAIDPSVVYYDSSAIDGGEEGSDSDPIPVSGFLVAGLTKLGISVARIGQSSSAFGPWQQVSDPPRGGLDKPWLISGTSNPAGREMYLIYMSDGSTYGCMRSNDYGRTWTKANPDGGDDGDMITVGGQPVTGVFCAYGAAVDNGGLYIGYRKSDTAFEFLKGQDNNTTGGVEFSYLTRPGGQRLQIPLTGRNMSDCVPFVPAFTIAYSRPTPQIAVDPSNPNRFYVVWHDTQTADDCDIDIWFSVVRFDVALNGWVASARKRVNSDNTIDEKDQFLPAISVNALGYIEIAFYDDRNWEQDDGDPNAKFDVWYAYSTNAGESFTNAELCKDPPDCKADDASLYFNYDFGLSRVGGIGEYMGIASRGRKTFVVFNGTKGASSYLQPEDYGIWSSTSTWP